MVRGRVDKFKMNLAVMHDYENCLKTLAKEHHRNEARKVQDWFMERNVPLFLAKVHSWGSQIGIENGNG